MTEKIIKEPVEGEPGATEPPAQPPSEPPAEPSAVDEATLKAIVEPLVEELLGRQTQSVKDKRIAKQESRISSLEDTLAQLKDLQADGMSEKQAIQYVKMEELLTSQGQEVPAAAPPAEEPAVQPKVASEDYLSPILKMAGLDVNDSDVIAILRDESSPFKRITAIEALSETRKQKPPLTPGAALPSGGGKAVETETLESVTAELQTELDKPVTPATRARIKELGKKHKELLPKK
jgi:hypothetical protein